MSTQQVLQQILARCTECGDCLLWPGMKDSAGKPLMRLPGSRAPHPVRRVILRAEGRWVEGRLAGNTCGRIDCVAPAHAVALTRGQLVRQAVRRTGYHLDPVRNAKIAAAKRAEVGRLNDPALRQAVIECELSHRAAAARFGISATTVGEIKRGEIYRQYGTPWQGLGARPPINRRHAGGCSGR